MAVECEKDDFSVNGREMRPSIASEISAAAAEPWIQGIVSVRSEECLMRGLKSW